MVAKRKYDIRKIALSYVLGAWKKILEDDQESVIVEKGDLAIRFNPNPMAAALISQAMQALGWEDGGKFWIYRKETIPFTKEKLKKLGIDPESLLQRSKASASESKSSAD